MPTPETDVPIACEVPTQPNWRQGTIIPRPSALSLGLLNEDDADSVAIVVTHDCDCVQDQVAEPYLEIMAGQLISEANQSLTNARSARTLHLPIEREGAPIVLQMKATPKLAILKRDLVGIDPDPAFVLSEASKRTLSTWLRARYSRTSFPNNLVERMRSVQGTLEDAGKGSPYAIHGIYLHHDPNDELPDDQIYEIEIFVVYNSEIEDAQQTAEAAAEKIRRRFELKFKTFPTEGIGLRWQSIELTNCEAMSDLDFTLADLLTFQIFRLDHVSLRQDPQGEILDSA